MTNPSGQLNVLLVIRVFIIFMWFPLFPAVLQFPPFALRLFIDQWLMIRGSFPGQLCGYTNPVEAPPCQPRHLSNRRPIVNPFDLAPRTDQVESQLRPDTIGLVHRLHSVTAPRCPVWPLRQTTSRAHSGSIRIQIKIPNHFIEVIRPCREREG